MRTLKIASLVIPEIMIVFAVTCGRVSAFPLGWGHPCVIDSSSAEKACVQGLADPANEWQYVFWHDSDDSIRYRSRDMDGSWTAWGPTYAVAYASRDAFGAAVDSSGNLHVVWADNSEIEPLGETSNLFYMEMTPWSKEDTIHNITPLFNVPSEEDSLVEDFEGGVMPASWGTDGSANSDADGPWGLWSVQNGQGVDSSYCVVGRCTDTSWPRAKRFYLFMPPVVIPADTVADAEFSFCYRVDREDSLRLRLVGFEGFPIQNHLDLTKPNKADRQFVLWDSLITNTSFATAAVSLVDSLEGEFLHLAFEIRAGVTGAANPDTTVRVCVDGVAFRGVTYDLRPRIPKEPSLSFDPVVATDGGGNVHVAFTRIHWQPEACVCRDQVYYAKFDAGSSTWLAPVHVDSSGIGDRNWAKPGGVVRRGQHAAIAVDHRQNVHLAWTDNKTMNYTDCEDDVFYIRTHAGSSLGWWGGYEELSDDGDGQGVWDARWCLQPDLAVDTAGRVIAVFHGSRLQPGGGEPSPLVTPAHDTLRIWCRTSTSEGSWPDPCVFVPDPPRSGSTPMDCRCPVIDVDDLGNMYVAYTWSDVIDRHEPEALAVAHYFGRDSEWVWPARTVRDPRNLVSVERVPCVQAEGFVFWCENDTSGAWGAVWGKRSLVHWVSGDPPTVEMTVDEFTRGLCPSDDDSLDADEKSIFEILLTVKDGEGIPLPGFPPDSLYVTVAGDTAGPPDTCFTLDDAGFGRADSTYHFWCESDDTLFASDTTGVEGTWIRVKNVSGKARLRLQAHFGASPRGAEDTVWINSVDQVPSLPDGKVTGPDFSSFSTAYNAWRFDSLESWVWDILHQSGDTCSAGGEGIPIFDVDGGDFSWFNYHYQDSLETGDCDD